MAKDYKMYSCPDPAAAMTCNKECTAEGNGHSGDTIIRHKFKVNVQQQKIIKITDNTISNWEIDGSSKRFSVTQVLENCTVIDEGTWVCESDFRGCSYTNRMLNNIYSGYPKTCQERKSSYCAK
jgi:hypothetical protein